MRLLLPAAVALVAAASCTTFTSVRSAEVRPGPSFHAQASVASPVGDEAGWFYSYDCSSACNTAVAGADVDFATAFSTAGGRGSTIGIGTSGFYPSIEFYTELDSSRRHPFGLGGRLGLPLLGGWSEHRVYARVDVANREGTRRFLWNPGVVLTTGSSPNGQERGSVMGLSNGFGLQLGDGPVAFVPSFSVVAARGGHSSYSHPATPEWSAFATAGLGVTFRRSRR
jgi:hypothetical protein